MDPLHYTSEEMYSSTELIRKSKSIFDKLNKKDIEKAIILRDGKPAFMLLEFSEYEKIMKEYLSFKQMNINTAKKTNENIQVVDEVKKTIIEEEKVELSDEDLKKALEQIENLDMNGNKEKALSDEEKIKEQKEALKEFWE